MELTKLEREFLAYAHVALGNEGELRFYCALGAAFLDESLSAEQQAVARGIADEMCAKYSADDFTRAIEWFHRAQRLHEENGYNEGVAAVEDAINFALWAMPQEVPA